MGYILGIKEQKCTIPHTTKMKHLIAVPKQLSFLKSVEQFSRNRDLTRPPKLTRLCDLQPTGDIIPGIEGYGVAKFGVVSSSSFKDNRRKTFVRAVDIDDCIM